MIDNTTHGRVPVLVARTRVATVDVVLQRDLDFAAAPAILQEVGRRIRRLRPAVVVVDLADVTHADSSGLRMLAMMAGIATEVGASLRLRHLSPLVRRIIAGSHVSTVLGLGGADPPKAPVDSSGHVVIEDSSDSGQQRRRERRRPERARLDVPNREPVRPSRL